MPQGRPANIPGFSIYCVAAACAALASSEDDFKQCVEEWRVRRTEVMRQLEGLPFIIPKGGWSLLLDVKKMGFNSFAASKRLLEKGNIAVTPKKDWGEKNSDQFVRLVFSNEMVARFSNLRERVNLALQHS